jgi:PAS domain S-box-containing protein
MVRMPSVAAFIADAHEAILEAFVREAGGVPRARALTSEEVLDSLPEYLGLLGASAGSDESVVARTGERRVLEESHALLRLRLGFEADQVEAEYDLILRLVISSWERRPAGQRPDPEEVGRLARCLIEARRTARRLFDDYTQAEHQREKFYLHQLERHAERMIYISGQSVPLAARFEPLLAVIQEATGAEGGALHMATPAGGVVAFTASVGGGGGPTGYLAAALAPGTFRDRVLGSFIAIAGSLQVEGNPKHLLAMRLPPHGVLQGALVVGAADPFSLRQRRDFEALADRLARAVHRIRLFERLPTRHGTVRVPGRKEVRDLVGEVERSRLRHLFLGIYEWDVASGELGWSESASTLLGYPIDELGTHVDWWRQRIHPDDLTRVLESLDEACAGRADHWNSEYRLLTRDAGYMLIADHGLILRDPEGRAERMIGAFQNIGQQREAEQALRASEERLNLALRAAGMGTWDYDPVADRFHWDERKRSLAGVGPDEVIDFAAFLDLLDPGDRDRVEAAARRALEPGGSNEFDEEYRIRAERWVRTIGRAYFDDGRATRFIGVTLDVSALHEAADALARSERRFRDLADAMPQLVWTAKPDGSLDYVNRRSLEYSGLESQHHFGDRWHQLIHPEDVEMVVRRWTECVAAGTGYEAKQRIRAADGSYRWFLSRGIPIRDRPDGPVRGWLGTNTDITDLVRAEEVLRRSTEFAQQLVGIVSHDLRNPLNAMLVGAQLLLRSGDLDPRQARTASRILTAGERAVRLVGDLLDLTRARLGEGLPIVPTEGVEFDEVVGRVIDEARLAHPDRAIRFASGGAGRGRWDADRLAQVVTNLVSNAVSYSPPGTTVKIETRGADDQVEVVVHNLGDPIPPDLLPRIFEPMLRGRGGSASGGLGMGLFIVDRIVRSHGGRVEVASTAAEGTSFRVVLPRSPGTR